MSLHKRIEQQSTPADLDITKYLEKTILELKTQCDGYQKRLMLEILKEIEQKNQQEYKNMQSLLTALESHHLLDIRKHGDHWIIQNPGSLTIEMVELIQKKFEKMQKITSQNITAAVKEVLIDKIIVLTSDPEAEAIKKYKILEIMIGLLGPSTKTNLEKIQDFAEYVKSQEQLLAEKQPKEASISMFGLWQKPQEISFIASVDVILQEVQHKLPEYKLTHN